MPSQCRTFCLLFTFCGALGQTANRVQFSLGSFQNVNVPENNTLEVMVSSIPQDVAFLTIQFHTLNSNATLSFSEVPNGSISHTAVDSGLLSPLLPSQTALTWYLLSPAHSSIQGTGIILPYSSGDPIPGGCNSDDELDSDPNVHLQYNLFETVIRVSPASTGHPRGATPAACNASGEGSTRLAYDVYRYLLPEGDFTPQTLLSYIQTAASVPSITAYGTKVVSLSQGQSLSVTLRSLPGRGLIYSVIVRDLLVNTSASYVPVHTYACDLSSLLDGCTTLGRLSTKILFTTAGVTGLFVCFFGHRFFKFELFWMGFVFSAFWFFVLVTRTTALDYDLRLALTAVFGVMGAVLLVLSWWRFGSVLCCVLVVGLILGFLVSSVFFFAAAGDLPMFRSDAVFWVTFSGIALFVPLLFLRWPREGNISTCGVGGAYAVVLAVGSYISTSLSYITLDVLRRLLDSSSSAVLLSVPLQAIDYVLLTLWVVLAVSGLVVQLHRERTRPFFPPSPYLVWKQERDRRKTNVLDPSHHVPPLSQQIQTVVLGLLRRRQPAGEYTPLLL